MTSSDTNTPPTINALKHVANLLTATASATLANLVRFAHASFFSPTIAALANT
jgi:hypothetical protein